MANNCIVSTLKGNVNKDNLDYFKAVRINLKSTQQVAYFQVGDGQAEKRTCKLFGSAVFTSSDGSQNYGQEKTDYSFYIKNINDGDYIVIYGKYELKKLYTTVNVVFIEDDYKLNLDYCQEIGFLGFGNSNKVEIDLNRFSLYNKKIKYFRQFYDNNIYGNLETIAENMLANGRDGSVANDIFCIGTDSTNFKLNGVKTTNDYNTINFISSSSIIIYAGENKTSGTVVASYDGSTWTYA